MPAQVKSLDRNGLAASDCPGRQAQARGLQPLVGGLEAAVDGPVRIAVFEAPPDGIEPPTDCS